MNDAVKKYFDAQPSLQRGILEKIRALVLQKAPEAKECMSYGVPAFKLQRNLIVYGAFTNHIGLYPEPDTIKAFHKELQGYKTSKGAIIFPLDAPIDYGLIEKIIDYRYKLLKK